jgi:hypothetical protein
VLGPLRSWYRRRRRPLDPNVLVEREEARRSTDQLLNQKTLSRHGPRGFTGDTGPRRS